MNKETKRMREIAKSVNIIQPKGLHSPTCKCLYCIQKRGKLQ